MPELRLRSNAKRCNIEGCERPYYAKGYCNLHWSRNHKRGDPLNAGRGRAPNGAPLAWLLAHVDYQCDDCLIFPFAKTRWGYGDLWVDGEHWRSHRYMCTLAHGPAPSPTHESLHSCGNGHLGCTNPCHLRWGTSKENKADTLLHGRRIRGASKPNSKLTEADVHEIRRLLTSGLSQSKIAASFGLCQQSVFDIKHRRLWGWLP